MSTTWTLFATSSTSQHIGDVRHPPFPDFSFRNVVLHFLKNAQLYLPCKKFSPTYVGPLTIKSLLGEARLSDTPVSVDPDGSGWYQIEEILDHRGPATNDGECLVRWKDFDVSHDSWIRRHSVTPLC
jgi:hypothetical protein